MKSGPSRVNAPLGHYSAVIPGSRRNRDHPVMEIVPNKALSLSLSNKSLSLSLSLNQPAMTKLPPPPPPSPGAR